MFGELSVLVGSDGRAHAVVLGILEEVLLGEVWNLFCFVELSCADEIEGFLLEDSEKLIVGAAIEDVEHDCCGLSVDGIDVVLKVDDIGVELGWELQISVVVNEVKVLVKV